jgi:hypothetical protein
MTQLKESLDPLIIMHIIKKTKCFETKEVCICKVQKEKLISLNVSYISNLRSFNTQRVDH